MNSFLATLGPFHHPCERELKGFDRLNSRESLRERIDHPLTVQLNFVSTGQGRAELPIPRQGMSKEYPSIGSSALAVNGQIQTLSMTNNEAVILQVRFDKIFIYLYD